MSQDINSFNFTTSKGDKVSIKYSGSDHFYFEDVTINGYTLKKHIPKIQIKINEKFPSTTKELWLSMIELHPDDRGNGYGGALIECIEKIAEKFDCELISGSAENESAKSFFSKQGYSFGTGLNFKKILDKEKVVVTSDLNALQNQPPIFYDENQSSLISRNNQIENQSDMDYQLIDGEVLFCGKCKMQYTTDKVNTNFTCKVCGSKVTSWYANQTHEEALKSWENVNGLTNKNISNPIPIINNQNQSSIMSRNNQIENQIDLLNQAKAVFVQHSQFMENNIMEFNSAVRSFEQDDLNHDYVSFLEEFFKEYSSKLKSISQDIDDEYIPAIIRKIRYLEERE